MFFFSSIVNSFFRKKVYLLASKVRLDDIHQGTNNQDSFLSDRQKDSLYLFVKYGRSKQQYIDQDHQEDLGYFNV